MMHFALHEFRIYKSLNLGLDGGVKRKGNVPWVMLVLTIILFLYSIPLLVEDRPIAFKIGALFPAILLGAGTTVIWFMRVSMSKPRREVPPPLPKEPASRD